MNIWSLIAVQPMTNVLIALSHYLFNSFGLAIIALTIIVNALMLPLTLKQVRATKAMQELQPKIAELQKKYAKDKERLAQEQMKLYKESGLSPAGCIIPLVIQIPIWFALYQSITRLLAVTPEDFLALSHNLYSWPLVYSTVPLGGQFLWFNLAYPDAYIILPILVGGTMWVQQKMVTPPVVTDQRQQAQNRLMLWIMPLLFGGFTLQFPSGLALFWVTSSLFRIGMQYFVTGWGGLIPERAGKRVKAEKKLKQPVTPLAEVPVKEAGLAEAGATREEEGQDYGKPGDKRQDRGGGYPTRLRAARRKPRRGRGHRPERR